MISAEAIDRIAMLAVAAEPVEIITVDGRKYTKDGLTEVVQKEREPVALVVHTLTGIVDYLQANRDGLTLSDYLLHVASPDRVDLLSKVTGEHRQRLKFVSAVSHDRFKALPHFAFGKYMDLETFNVSIQALFQDAGDRAYVLQLLGSVTDDAVVTREDDGRTQKVTARTAIVMKDKVPVPNPVMLAPFRTFPEIEQQPVSPFVLRVKKGSDDQMGAALFEADGGAWINAAVLAVSGWLSERLPEITVIA